MTFYLYEGIKRDGSKVKGKAQGHSTMEISKNLKLKKIKPISIVEQKKNLANTEIKLLKQVSLKQLVSYLQQMSTLISSGITILEASILLEKQTKEKNFKRILEEVRISLENGLTLSESYKKHPESFPVLLINIVSVAESSGSIEKSLKQVANYYEKLKERRGNMITVLLYPIMMFIAAIGVSIFLMTSIVPMFIGIFESLNAPLPPITKFVLAVSNFLTQKSFLLIVIIVTLFVVATVAKRNQSFVLKLDTIKLRLPIFGDLVKKNDFSLFMSSISTLLASSVSMEKALEMSKGVVKNSYLCMVINQAERAVIQGDRMSVIFKNNQLIPLMVSQMIEIGERTGALEEMLERLSTIFEKDVDESSTRIKTVLEPIIMVVIAAIVGFIVAAIMLPMFSLYTTLQG